MTFDPTVSQCDQLGGTEGCDGKSAKRLPKWFRDVLEVFGFSRWFTGWVSVVAIGPLREFSDHHGDRDLPDGDRRDCLPVGEGTERSFLPLARYSEMIRSYSRRDSGLP